MSLDVTAGTPVALASGGPPGPPGAGPPGSDPAALFAALLAGQVQTQGKVAETIPLLRTGVTKTPTVLPAQAGETAEGDAKTKEKANSQQDTTDPAVILWSVVPVLQPPPPLIQTPTVSITAESAVNGGPAIRQQEVMDTDSVQTPSASKAKAAMPTGELLPQPNENAVIAVPTEQDQTEQDQQGTNAEPPVPGFTPAQPVVTTGLTLTQNTATPSTASNTTVVTPGSPAAQDTPVQPSTDKATVVVSSTVTSPAPDVVIPSPLVASASTPTPRPQTTVLAAPSPVAEKALSLPSTDSPAQQSTVASLAGRAGDPAPQNAPPPQGQSALQNGTPPANNTGSTVSSAPMTPPVVSAAANVTQLPPVSVPVTDSQSMTVKAPQSAVGDKSATMKSAGQAMPKVASPSGENSGKKASADRGGADDQPRQTANPSSDATPTSVFTPVAGPPVGKADSTEAVVSAKPLTGAERAQVMRQAADAVSTLKPQIAPGGQGQMTVNLHPKEWGDLRLTVRVTPTVSAEGVPTTTVTAHIVASSPTVKTALEAHAGELNQALRETGMRLDRLTITVQKPEASAHSGSATGDGQGSSRNPADAWQPAQTQTSLGGGNSSPFASFSERQGREAFQSQPHAGTMNGGEEGDAEAIVPMSTRLPRPSAGFDQRV